MANEIERGVAILRTGNIEMDLQIKAMRSNVAYCALILSRNLRFDGTQKAGKMRVLISARSLDAASAAANRQHGSVLDGLGRTMIDMTAAKVDELCGPAINAEKIVKSGARSINLMTCGGQASTPIANGNTGMQDDTENIEVAPIGQLVWRASTTLEDGCRGTIEAML